MIDHDLLENAQAAIDMAQDMFAKHPNDPESLAVADALLGRAIEMLDEVLARGARAQIERN